MHGPPAHNDWDIKQFEGSEADRETYKKCIKEVNDYVRDVLDKYFRSESSHNEIIIPGLAELLPDLEKSDEGVPGTIGSGSSDGLQPSGKIAAKETAAPVSFIDEDAGKESKGMLPNPSKGMASSLVEDMGLKQDEGADSPRVIEFEHPQPEPEPGGGGGGGGGGGEPKETPPQKMTEKPGAKTLVQVRILFTPISYFKDGVLLHRLVLKPSPKEDAGLYKNIRIFIKTGTDNNTQDTADIKKIANVVRMLANGEALPPQYKDHPLVNNPAGFRDCYIENDWVLLYKIQDDILILTLADTGTHSDLDL